MSLWLYPIEITAVLETWKNFSNIICNFRRDIATLMYEQCLRNQVVPVHTLASRVPAA
jgi:hypothetical protein